MKKRFTAIILAFALCIGLTTSALATEFPDSYEEAFENISLTYTLGGEHIGSLGISTLNARVPVEKPLTLVYYNWDNSTGNIVQDVYTANSYDAIRENTEFTLSYTGSPADDNSYVYVCQSTFVNQGDGRYVKVERHQTSYLTKQGRFIMEYFDSEPYGGWVMLKAGESVKFKFTKYVIREYNSATGEYEYIEPKDVIYELEFRKMYPDTERIEGGQSVTSYYHVSNYFKVDEGAVDAHMKGYPFSDAPMGRWFSDAVNWAVAGDLTNGTGSGRFSPSQNCTHAQILTFLYRANRGQGTAEAADMEKAVSWAKQKGMIDSSFDGGKFCTRAEAVNYIWQAFDKPTAKASSFTDVPSTSAYAKAVSWAVEKGVTNGTNAAQTQFSPDKICDRGTIVTFLYRAYTN